jgi:hypothetical protein
MTAAAVIERESETSSNFAAGRSEGGVHGSGVRGGAGSWRGSGQTYGWWLWLSP